MGSSVEIASLCRICGCASSNALSLFPDVDVGDALSPKVEQYSEDSANLTVVDRINKYLPIEVTRQSPFPKVVCLDCNQGILDMVLFWEKFSSGQAKLFNLLKEKGVDVGSWTLKTPVYKLDHLDKVKAKSHRGRPKKGFEKNKISPPSIVPINDTNYDPDRGKRRKKVPQKFSDSIHNINTYSDDLSEQSIGLDEGEKDEDYPRISLDINTISDSELTVSVDVSDLENTSSGCAPLLPDISGLLHQLSNPSLPPTKLPTANVEKIKTSVACEICGKQLKSEAVLARHVMRHGEIKYRCDHQNCELLVDTKDQLNTHHGETGHEGVIVVEFKERVHEQKDDNITGECEDNLINNQIASKIDVDMSSMKMEAPKDANDMTVTNDETGDGLASCPHCADGLIFSSKLALKTHIEVIHGGKQLLPCVYCKETFAHKQALTSHITSFHQDREGDKSYPCGECDRVFNRPSSLSYHKDAVHTFARFPCSVPGCEKEFKMRNLLTRHMLTHNTDRPHQCEECEASFKTASNLKAHQSKHSGEVKYFCHECGQPFKHKTSLNQHMRWHTGERPFKCDFCGKSFGQNGNLQEHLRIHTGEKPFKCELCPRSFTTSSQHRLHLKRHTGDRPHKCEFCGKTFLHSETYKAHVRRHKGEKPFECKFCHKGFAESWALTKHSRFHTGVQPYKCLVCGKAFSDSSNLSKHKKTHRDYDGDKLKQTVWKIIRDAGGAEVNSAARVDKLDMVDEDTQQVIYVTFQDGAEKEVKVVETEVKDGGLDLSNLSSQTMMVDTGEDPVVTSHDTSNQDGHTIDLTTRDGQQIRLVAPLNIDPLAFATEYLKDLQQIHN